MCCSSMAETDETESNYTKPQKLASDQQNHENPSRFYNHFLYKVVIVVVFFVILPLYPSQPPEIFNQSVLTRSWELLHLLLVGIAVSYGLFSRRNEKAEKETNNAKFDNAHSYVSRFLQVSSVFDDESEPSSGSDENKVQTWSSQYYRNEPVVVVAQEHSALDEQRSSTTSIIGEKPLLLPVRSLKQRVSDSDYIQPVVNESSASSGSPSRTNSRSGSKRFSSKSSKARGGELGSLDHKQLEEKLKKSVVLPSPIPWRSRSGRIEVKEDVLNSPTMEEAEFKRQDSWGSSSQGSRSSLSNSMSSSPKLSPSPSLSSPKKASLSPALSSESQAKNVEDLGRKKSFYKASPPPPPPPPPMFYKSSSLRPSKDGVLYDKHSVGRVSAGVDTKHRSCDDGLSMEKSARTTRASESKSSREVGADLVEKATRKRVGFDETSFWPENFNVPNSAIDEFSGEETEDFFDKATMESDEETGNEDDDSFEDSFVQKDIGETSRPSPKDDASVSGNASDGGPDVDKKADEFIAKFREQIRLQRIDLIKKSSAQISRNLSR